jgi:histidyl-tRNA synthetase
LIFDLATLLSHSIMERLPGFRDFYPEPLPTAEVGSADARQYIFSRWRAMAQRYGFREYDGPPLETLELFTTKSGHEIVGQLYNFVDKGERAVALRPEMTPTLARMIGAYERNYKKPIKWFALPQLFRYEKQQKGRLREHFQFNADIIGENDSAADAELIALLIDTLRSFGLAAEDFVIRLSSRQAWHEFFERRQGDPAREYEFFQAIDKLDRDAPEESERKLRDAGFSLVDVNAFIEQAEPTGDLRPILDNLTTRGLAGFLKIDYRVIRGLAYYTGPVFEAFDKKGDCPRAIAGGGRYDKLIGLISGGKINLAALGFGMGDVVLLDLLKARGLLPGFDGGIEVYCIVAQEDLRSQSLRLVQDLREAGFVVDYSLTPAKPDKQFKRAQELKAGYVAQLERSVGGEMTVRLRNLKTRQESVANPGGAAELLRGGA